MFWSRKGSPTPLSSMLCTFVVRKISVIEDMFSV